MTTIHQTRTSNNKPKEARAGALSDADVLKRTKTDEMTEIFRGIEYYTKRFFYRYLRKDLFAVLITMR